MNISPVKIISPFDGMACGYLAFQRAGIPIERYVAFEIDKHAVKTSSHNFPMIEHRGDVFKADFTEFRGFDFLIGGSPCTYWSIAQKNNRETEASGMGWELFSQYVRALHEAQPKYFIYENNKSMSNAIRDSISEAFGFEPVFINSALVSAQNRQRLYWVGRRNEDGTYSKVNVEQPVDRGILLRDVLDSGVHRSDKDKSFALTTRCCGATPEDTLKRSRHSMVAEEYKPLTEGEMEYMVRQTSGCRNHFDFGYIQDATKDKGACLTANISKGVPYNVCCEPVRIPDYGNDDKSRPVTACYAYKGSGEGSLASEAFPDNPSKQRRDYVAEPVRVGNYPFEDGRVSNSQGMRIYSPDGKSVTLCGNGGGKGAKTGLYSIPVDEDDSCPAMRVREATTKGYVDIEAGDCVDLTMPNSTTRRGRSMKEKSNCLMTGCQYYQYIGTVKHPIYEVKDGMITIKGKQYPIKLVDGFYIIRKLTVSECKRLQTVPEWYEFPVSDTQAYKMLGNGWTVDVICHLINSILTEENNKGV